MSHRDTAEELLRAAEAASATLIDGDAYPLWCAVTGAGYAVLAHLEGIENSQPPAGSHFLNIAKREEFMNELTAIFADTIRNNVTPGTRTALVMRFDRTVRGRLGW